MTSATANGNVADLVAAAADEPDRTAFIDPDGATVTWGGVEQRVAAFAGGLQGAGVGAGERVGIMLGNRSDFAVAYWGSLRTGACVVPINPGYTAPERQHILTDSGATALVVEPGTSVGQLTGVRVVTVDELQGTPVRTAVTAGDDAAVICYTSGTTGRPKGARLSHANLLANLDAFANLPLLTLSEDDVLLGLLPFFHVFGLNVVLNAAAKHRCCVAAVERFSPRGTAALLGELGVTVAYGAPPVFAALAALPAELELPALRAAISGADALPVRTWQRFADRFGLEILEGYGLTETSPVLASNAAAPAVRPGTVGLALPQVDLRVVDPTGAVVAAGQVGEIQARGPNVFSGYHNRPDESAEVLREGWFATGDLGAFDPDGYLTIAGRLKEMIIVSGFNVYPREVEEALGSHPAVAEVAVLGLPDERTGERVQAFAVAAAGHGLSAAELLDHARERLARYKLPRDIHVVDALPRLPTGKVNRSELRAGLTEKSPTGPPREGSERA
jgi:long-chain acyl-CoA synthetase